MNFSIFSHLNQEPASLYNQRFIEDPDPLIDRHTQMMTYGKIEVLD